MIITADWHLREDQPICRTDDYQAAQWDKVDQIITLQKKYDCPVFNAGDIFQHWRSSPALINKTIYQLSRMKKMVTVIGNHEMPKHNVDLMEQSAWDTLFRANSIDYLGRGNWLQDLEEMHPLTFKHKKVYMLHIMVWKGEQPWPGCEDPEADELIDIFPDADLIITGHNHKTFTERQGKTLLINPGSLTRHKADQEEHKPCVFLWDAERNEYKQHFLDIEKNVISREHIEKQKQRQKRIDSFVVKLAKGWDLRLSFEDNIERGIKVNKIPPKIVAIINDWMGI